MLLFPSEADTIQQSPDNRAHIPQDEDGVIINDDVPYRETYEVCYA